MRVLKQNAITIATALLFLVLVAGAVWAANMADCTSPSALNWDGTNGFSCNNLSIPVTTVGSLPTCTSGLKGRVYVVTDASALSTFLSIIAAGGSVTTTVLCNGTNWVVQ